MEGNLARVLAASGEVVAAEEAFRHALTILGTTEFDPSLAARPSREFGELLLRQEDYQGADNLLGNAVELWAATRPPDDDDILQAQGLRGVAMMHLGRFEEAEVILREAFDATASSYGPEDEAARAAAERLAELYDAWGRPEEANDVRAGR